MRLIPTPSGARRALAAWWRDRSGATLVQFIAILPMFIILVYGMWATFTVLGAHAALCEAAHESARYLQVEGPRFPEDDPSYAYPEGWARVAFDIARTEIPSHRALNEAVFTQDNVLIWPAIKPVAPSGPDQVLPELVPSSLFTVRVSAQIPNPLYLWFSGKGDDGQLALSCQSTGFFEDVPFKVTSADPGEGDVCERERNSRACQKPPRCTVGPPPTECGRDCPTPVCCPCRER